MRLDADGLVNKFETRFGLADGLNGIGEDAALLIKFNSNLQPQPPVGQLDLLGLGETQLEARRSLLELGLDSLMAVELRNWIESQIKIELPISELMRGANLEDLADTICVAIDDQIGEPTTSTEAGGLAAASPIAALPSMNAGEANEILGSISDLPQKDVESLLAQLLRQQEPETK